MVTRPDDIEPQSAPLRWRCRRQAAGRHIFWTWPVSGTTSAAQQHASLEPPRYGDVAGRVASAMLVVLVIGAAGSRGLPLPTSPQVYDRTIAATADAPEWFGHGIVVVSELGLVILAGGLGLSVWRRRDRASLVARSLASGVGVVVAYVLSEALKVAAAQPRPCRGLAVGTTLADCPSATDWSLPSNHAVIASGLAVALAFTVRRAAWWAVPLALGVCASRVITGVHYPHDVVSGVLLAAAVVSVMTLLLERPAVSVVERAAEWRFLGLPGPGGAWDRRRRRRRDEDPASL